MLNKKLEAKTLIMPLISISKLLLLAFTPASVASPRLN